MPLIDLKSDLARGVVKVLNDNERRRDDSSKLLKLLASGKGLTFAAKQAILDPKSAALRLASITAQLGLNTVPLGLGNHIGFNPNNGIFGNAVEGTASEPTKIRDRVSAYNSVATSAKDWTPYSNPGFLDETVENADYAYRYGDSMQRQRFSDTTTVIRPEEQERLNEFDTVPFYFTTYELNDGQVNLGYSLPFPAFFTNISDNVNGVWQGFSYAGRGEMFHVYQNYNRSFQASFKVAAFSKEELPKIKRRAEILRSFAAPSYVPTSGYMKGTFLKLTIGDYLKSVPGFITNISFTISNDFNWEIEDRSIIFPHVLDISFGFTILEQKTPQFIEYGEI